MPFALVAHAEVSSTPPDAVTPAIDTTGASLLVASIADYELGSTILSDSKANTWVPLTKRSVVTDACVQIYYCLNPTVGTGHTFTAHEASPSFCMLFVDALSSAELVAPFDQQNGAASAGATTLASGSITPSADGELIICACAGDSNITSIDSGFTVTDKEDYVVGVHFGGGLAYLIQTAATPVNPAWTQSGSVALAVAVASFKVAVAVSVPPDVPTFERVFDGTSFVLRELVAHDGTQFLPAVEKILTADGWLNL